jgi:prepilin-type N-terminal cleavage/methylation domain-containing protein
VKTQIGGIGDGRGGFTAIEMVVVVMLVAVLASISLRSFGSVLTGTNVRSALQTIQSVHAQARARAIERGQLSRFVIDATNDRVSVVVGNDTIETVNIGSNFDVDIQLATSTITLCMSPRGFGEADCNSFDGAQRIALTSGAETVTLVLFPLGQMIRSEAIPLDAN